MIWYRMVGIELYCIATNCIVLHIVSGVEWHNVLHENIGKLIIARHDFCIFPYYFHSLSFAITHNEANKITKKLM